MTNLISTLSNMGALQKLWWLLLPLAALLGYIFRARSEYWYSNQGEELVRKVLIKQLPPDSWHLMNNVTLPVADGTTQIDHVLVSRFGIFVIETKHYSGWIFGDQRSKQWTQVLYNQKNRFQNPLHQNYKHLKAVEAVLDFVPPVQISSVVVFTGDAEFMTDRPQGVYSLEELVAYLKGLDQMQLSENRMQFCVGRLECRRLALTRETDIEHRANLQTRYNKKSY